MKKARIYIYNTIAGLLTEDENGYKFEYDSDYLSNSKAEPISLALPLTDKAYISNVLHPFFDGLIPEGWILPGLAFLQGRLMLNTFHHLMHHYSYPQIKMMLKRHLRMVLRLGMF